MSEKPTEDQTPAEKFEHELSAVFVRWWEESDLTDGEMAEIAESVIERFCQEEVTFDSDIDLDDDDEEEDE